MPAKLRSSSADSSQLALFDSKIQPTVELRSQNGQYKTIYSEKINMQLTEFPRPRFIEDITNSLRAAASHNLENFKRRNIIGHSSLDSLTEEEIRAIKKAALRMPTNTSTSNSPLSRSWQLKYLKDFYDEVTTEGLGTFIKDVRFKKDVMNYSTFVGLYNDSDFQSAYNRALNAIKVGGEHPKVAFFLDMMKENPNKKVIVFVKHIHTAHMLSERLKEKGISSEVLETVRSANKNTKTKEQRKQLVKRIKDGDFGIVIATSVGTTKSDVDMVVLYGNTDYATSFIGRATNMGKIGDGGVRALVSSDTREVNGGYRVWALLKALHSNMLRDGNVLPTVEPRPRQKYLRYESTAEE